MSVEESTKTATILVVDDEPELRRLLTRVLESEGLQVIAAPGALEALALLKESTSLDNQQPAIDLALLDVALPGMNGMTLFSKMQQDERIRLIPVIFLTGDTEYQQKARAFEAGAVDYITKPFHRKDLLLRIRAHLREKFQREMEQQKVAGLANQAQMSLIETEQRFSALVRNSFHLVCELDSELCITYASPNHHEILHLNPSSLLGTPWVSHIHPTEREDVLEGLKEILRTDCEKRLLLQIRDGSKNWRWLDACGSVLKTGGGESHLLLVSRDITHSKETERYLQHLALHDSLTGLANREHFTNELEKVVNSHPEGGHWAVMYLDVDNFKIINDRYGHMYGDQVLRSVGAYLKRAFGKAKVVARFGGDEFCILIEMEDHDAAQRFAADVCHQVNLTPLYAAGKRHRVTFSIGVAMLEGRLSVNEFILRANNALHIAKSQGKNRCFLYRSDSQELRLVHRSAEWFQLIQEALDESRFEAWYQPLIDIHTGEISNYEALIRYRNKQGDVHGPSAFLSSAERYSLMSQIDRYMIRHILHEISRIPDFNVSINLSGSSVTDPNIVAYILQCFDETGVNPQRVTFEITETVFMTNLVQARAIVEDLQGHGCRFALDDFGSGFSSLNYLRHLPVTVVKVDGSFIKEMHADPVNLMLLKSINEIAHLLGKQTVAEWIEDNASLHALRNIGFDYGQGFYTGKPKPLEAYFEGAACV